MSITINTNLSSLIVQFAMQGATIDLNRAIERMTTGNKINSAKDDAAGYAVMTGMSTKMGAYRIAEGNASAGLDMVSTAVNTLDLMNNQLSRLRSLAVQAQNGTYGAQSISAIQSEANSITSSLNQLKTSAEYNGKKLFSEVEPPAGFNQSGMPEVQESGFIGDITPVNTSSMKTLTQAVAEGRTIKGGTWAIGSVEDLVKLAELTNTTTDNTTGTTFVLSQDIDLSGIDNWTPIGDSSTNDKYQFKGSFNGNGHVISNLKINNPSNTSVGLFGFVNNNSSIIKNLGVENADIEAYGGAVIIGGSWSGFTITNCYSTGNVRGEECVGGIINGHNISMSFCYSTCNVYSYQSAGGIAAFVDGTITNCYSTGNVCGGDDSTGGLLGTFYDGVLTNCYSTGNVYGDDSVGGLVGHTQNSTISNCYATGDVAGGCSGYSVVGGLVGVAGSTITSCYSTGNVSGVSDVGGLVGTFSVSDGMIWMSSSYSKVSGQNKTGSFVGNIYIAPGSITRIMTCEALPQNLPVIGGCYNSYGNPDDYNYNILASYITDTQYRETSLQVGIDGSQYSVITTDTGFKKNVLAGLNGLDITRSDAISAIDKVISDITSKQTELGAVQNRLESVLDSITVQYDNLVSARSVIKDADVAKESAAYIKSQILQNASATLLATANQSPSLALTLIGGLQRG